MRKLIVGCGYVGERVARAWRTAGDDVCVLSRSAERAAGIASQGWQTIVGDVTDPDVLRGAGPFDAALYAVGFDRAGGKSQREVYVDGLRNVVRNLHGEVGRWLYISSSSVYGQERGETVDESSECRPATVSGKVCLDAEGVFKELYPDSVRPVNILRLAGIYGPGRLIARTEQLKQGLPVTGTPNSWLNLIHVDDAVSVVLACEAQGKPGETFVVCDDRPLLRREFYTAICNLVGAPAPDFDEAPDFSGLKTAGLNKRLSNAKLKRDLGVTLLYPSIEQGLPQALGPG